MLHHNIAYISSSRGQPYHHRVRDWPQGKTLKKSPHAKVTLVLLAVIEDDWTSDCCCSSPLLSADHPIPEEKLWTG